MEISIIVIIIKKSEAGGVLVESNGGGGKWGNVKRYGTLPASVKNLRCAQPDDVWRLNDDDSA